MARRKRGLGPFSWQRETQKTSRPAGRRKALFEPLEPRLLLSADTLLPGIGDATHQGLDAFGGRVQEFVDTNLLFDTYVPGVVSYDESPSVRETLAAEVDINRDGTISGTGETALDALDTGNDGKVDFEEFFSAYFTDEIKAFLDGYDTTGKDLAAFQTDFGTFLQTGLDASGDDNYYIGTLGNLLIYDTLDVAVDNADIDGDGSASSVSADGASFDLNFSLTLSHLYPISLGDQANDLKIQPETRYTWLDSKVALDFVLGFDNAAGEFYMVVPDGEKLSVTVDTHNDTQGNLSTNVGFLETWAGYDAANDDFSILMPISTPVHDPSDPDALGFETLPNASGDTVPGTVTADAAPENLGLNYDVLFSLEIGGNGKIAPVEIVLQAENTNGTNTDGSTGGGSANETLDDLLTDIRNAIETASPGLADLVTVSQDAAGKITLSLPATQSDLLGFNNGGSGEAFAADDNADGTVVLTASAAPTGDGATVYEFTQDVTFLVSVDGQLPYVITLPATDAAIEELGFAPAEAAVLLPLTAAAAGPADGKLGAPGSGDKTFTITATMTGGATHTKTFTLYELDPDGAGSKTGWGDNASLADLVQDINDALLGTLWGLFGNWGQRLVAAVSSDRIVLNAIDSGVTSIAVAEGNGGLAAVGFTNGQVVTLSMTTDADASAIALKSAATLDVLVTPTGGGAEQTYTITVPAATEPADFLTTVNSALASAGVGDRIEAVAEGSRFTLRVKASAVTSVASFQVVVPKVTKGNLSASDLAADVNRVLSDAGITGITAGAELGKLTLTHTGVAGDPAETLEVTRKLTLDADGHITKAELDAAALSDLFPDPAADPAASFYVNLGVKAKTGAEPGVGEIWDTSGGADPDAWTYYEPSSILKVEFDPFDPGTMTPVTTEGRTLVSFELTDGAGTPLVKADRDNPSTDTSTFDALLDFNVISAEEVATLISQLEGWLDRLPDTPLLNNTDVPFAKAVLGNLLDFGDLVGDELLINDMDDGLKKPGEDGYNEVPKLLGYDSEGNLGVRYVTAQDMAYLLGAAAGQLDLLTGIKPVRYDPAAKELTYNLGLEHTFTTVTAPVDFGVELDPLFGLYSESQVELHAIGYFDAVMGLKMGEDVGNVDDTTALAALDIAIKEGTDSLAITGAEDVLKVYGRLTADAGFDVTIKRDGQPDAVGRVTVYKGDPDGAGVLTGTDDNLVAGDLILDLNNALAHARNASYILGNAVSASDYVLESDASFTVAPGGGLNPVTVTVKAAATAGNASLADLVADLNAALTLSGARVVAQVSGSSIKLTTPDGSFLAFAVTAPAASPFGFAAGTTNASHMTIDLSSYLSAALVDGRIRLDAAAGVKGFSVNSAANNTAFTELGIRPNTAYTVATAGTAVTNFAPGNVDFSIYLNGSATATTIQVGNTAGNASLSDLVLDVNQAIAATALSGKIAAGRSGQQIVLAAVDSSVDVFKVSGAGLFGFVDGQVAGVSLTGAQNVGYSPDGTISAAGIFGQLTGAAHFTITLNPDDAAPTVKNITVAPDDTNQSLDDLVADVNAALAAPAVLLGDKIVAERDGNKLRFRAIHDSVLKFSVAALGTDPAVTELGLAAGTTAAEAVLAVRASADVPVYFGPAADASFKVRIQKDDLSDTTYLVSLGVADSLANRSIYNLVQNLNAALAEAVKLDGSGTPVLVDGKAVTADLRGMVRFDKDGARLVLEEVAGGGVATFSVTANVADPAKTDLKLYDVTSPLPGSGEATFAANTADLLIRTSIGAHYAVALDGVTTIGGVIDAINAQTGGAVTAGLNDKRTGLVLTDNTGGTARMFNVSTVNRSSAALLLGIFGSDVTVVDLGEGKVADHVIEGSRLRQEQLGDRFFLAPLEANRPFLSADVWLVVPDLPLPDVGDEFSATGNFGFVEVKLTGDGPLSMYAADFDMALADNSGVYLTELFDALGNADGNTIPGQLTDLETAVNVPTFEVAPPNVTGGRIDTFALTWDSWMTVDVAGSEYDVVIRAADAALIGFSDGQTATNVLTASAVPTDFAPGAKVTFELVFAKDGVVDAYTVALPSWLTAGNSTLDNLVTDLQYALAHATDGAGNTVNLTADYPDGYPAPLAKVTAGSDGTHLTMTASVEGTALTVNSLGTTADNETISDLVADVNAALAAAGLTGSREIRAREHHGRIRLEGIGSEARSFYILTGGSSIGLPWNANSSSDHFTLDAAVDPPFTWADGSSLDAGDGQLVIFLTDPGSPFAAPPYLVAAAAPAASFQLSADATFKISLNSDTPVTVKVKASDTADNATLADLIGDINTALGRYSSLAGRITAMDDGGGKLRFEAADASVDSFVITAPAVNDLGLGASQESFDPGAPTATVTSSNLSDLAELGDLGLLGDVDFSLVLAALGKGAEFLDRFGALPFLAETLPFLGESINDYLDLAGRFRQALAAIEQNPSASIQDLDLAIRQSFGLPPDIPSEELKFYTALGLADTATPPVGLKIVDGILQIALRLPVGFIDGNLPVNMDLGAFAAGGENLFLQGDTGLGARGYLDARLGLGIDLNNPDPDHIVLFESDSSGNPLTGIVGDFVASNGSTPLNFGINIDTRGLSVRDGVIDIDLDIGLGKTGPFTPNAYIADLSDMAAVFAGFTKTFNVPAFDVVLPVFNFDGSQYIGEIGFDPTFSLDGAMNLLSSGLPDIADEVKEIDFANFSLFENLFSMIDGLDDFLATVQGILDGDVFGFQLPFIGDQLAAGADFIDNIRKNIIAPFEEFIQETPGLVADTIRDFLFAILGPGGDNVASMPDNLPGLGMLVKYELDAQGNIVKLAELGDGVNYSEAQIAEAVKLIGDQDAESVKWDFRLGNSFQPDFNIDFNPGWPALGLDLDADLIVNIDWSFVAGIGISLANGVFFDVSHEDDLTVDLGVEIATGSTMTGRLAFLQLEVDAVEIDFDGDGQPDPNRFEAGFTVDLTETGTGADGLVKFSELTSNLDVGIGVAAGAELNLALEVKFNEAILPDTISALLPSVTTNFVLDWGMQVEDLLAGGFEFDLGSGLTLVAFNDVTIDMGSFIGDLLGPVVDKIQDITEPIQPIIDILTAPIPVLSQLAGQDITLIDIAEMTGYIDAGMIYAIADLITFVNSIPAEPGYLGIVLGDFVLIGEGASSGLTGSSLTDPNFDMRDDANFDLKSALPAGFSDTLEGFTGLLDGATGDASSKDTMKNLADSGGAGGGFAFPILENPSQIFGLLLGRPAVLVTYDLPPFSLDFTWSVGFPIYPPLFGRVGASLGVTIDFAFGYDTEGVARFVEGNCENPLDLLAGFYVSDTDLPEGTGGTDVPELVFQGEISVGAELSAAGLVTAGVEAAIALTVNFDLYDPDHDGRVRIDELVNTFLYELRSGDPILAPIAIFDIYGDVSFQLRAYISILMLELEFEITPKIVLFEFSVPFEREPILGTERADALLLNVGPNSGSRLNGDTSDIGETIDVKYLGGDSWEVWSDQFGVTSGGAQVYAGERLIVYGGEGNDVINVDLGGNGPVDIEFFGGPGDDTLTVQNGQANVTFRGGVGNDTATIDTTGGANVIYGEEGADTITVTGGSSSTVFGDNGLLRIDRGTGLRDKAIGWVNDETDGIDTITTGDGNDVVFGGGAADIIKTGGGNDLAIGDGGYFTFQAGEVPHNSPSVDLDEITLYMGSGANDVIWGGAGDDALFGGPGDDILDGGAGKDQVLGGDGADVLYGGSDADDIYGEKGRDTIFGFRDPQATADKADTADVAADSGDLIYGGDHQDYVRGNGGNDVIYGEQADDVLFGDEGNDLIYGSLGSDLIFGGAGSDIIDGSEGSDVVFGDDGLVAYVNYDDSLPASDFIGSLIRITADGHKLIGDAPTSKLTEVLAAGFTADDDPLSPDIYLTAVAATDGNDVVAGGAGSDIVLGGAGNDWVGGDVPLFKTYSDNPEETDTDLYTLTSDAALDGRPVVQATGGEGTIDLGGGQYLVLTTALPEEDPPGEDVMLGDSGRIEFYGRRYSRILSLDEAPIDGQSYADTLLGDNGEDIGFGGTGNDVIYGGHRPALGVVPQLKTAGGALIYDANGDPVYDDNDILLGDNGVVEFYVSARQPERIYTTDEVETTGGADTIDGREGDDVVIGGVNNGSPDVLMGNVGHDVLLGDNGLLDYADEPVALTAEADASLTLSAAVIFKVRIGDETPAQVTVAAGTYANMAALVAAVNAGLTDAGLNTLVAASADGNRIHLEAIGASVEKFMVSAQIGNALGFAVKQTAPDLTTLDLVRGFIDGDGGADTISGNAGNDMVMGGTGADTIYGDDAAASAGNKDYGDILFGDNGIIRLGGHVPYRLSVMGSAVVFLHTADETNATGGGDTISGNADSDVIIGGVSNGETDTLYGDRSNPNATTAGNDDDDVLLGDNGLLHFAYGADADLTTLDIVATRQYKVTEASILDWDFGSFTTDDSVILGGDDVISGNTGRDTAFGGVGSDEIYGDAETPGTTDLADILLGDNGEILMDGHLPYKLEILDSAVRLIRTTDNEEATGADDVVEGRVGDDVIIGGVNQGGQDELSGNTDDDIILGDNGKLDFDFRFGVPEGETAKDLTTLDLIESSIDGLGGVDVISGDEGGDVAMGGMSGDFIYGDDDGATHGNADGEDILVGDNAAILLSGNVLGHGRLEILDSAVNMIQTIDELNGTGGADLIEGNAKSDVILGGVNGPDADTKEYLYGDAAYADGDAPPAYDLADVILGDNGVLDFAYAGDVNLNTLDLLQSRPYAIGKASVLDGNDEFTAIDPAVLLGGDDVIAGNRDADAAIGGVGDDILYGDDEFATAGVADGRDILLGDNAEIFLNGLVGELKILGSAVRTIRTTDIIEETGGVETIEGNAKGDVIAGGVKGDTLYGDALVKGLYDGTDQFATDAKIKGDIILGDNARLDWASDGDFGEISGGADYVAAQNDEGLADLATTPDTDLNTLDLVTTELPEAHPGGRDTIYGDAGRDVVFGGEDSDTIYGDDGDLEAASTTGDSDVIFGDHGRLYPQHSHLADFPSRNFFAIDMGDEDNGEGDRIFGEEGDDVLLGQQGDDRMFGGSGDDEMTGGHNVAGGYDELGAPAIAASLTDPIDPPVIGDVNDLMDGGSGDDAMAGDNAIIWRRADDLSPRFRLLIGGDGPMYTTGLDPVTSNEKIDTNVTGDSQSNPDAVVERDITLLDHSDEVLGNPLGRFGLDVMAGGADDDTMFGQLGNDLMQGDGLIRIGGSTDGAGTTRQIDVTDGGAPSTAGTLFFMVPEDAAAGGDGNDYMEGNGGDDLMYGGLGQDDMIGGSSSLFGLSTEQMRPDGSDTIYGGAGIQLGRNDDGNSDSLGHAHDSDFIMGDNADVFRLVDGADAYRIFEYDNYGESETIVPRAMRQLDYTLGGADYAGGSYANGAANQDNGARDLIKGEDGDDFIFGMTGSDILFGNAQDDDIVGGYGNDWISGGTGQDGVLGDDGLIYTSRNSSGHGEDLYGIDALLDKDPEPKYANGNVLNEVIATPGQIQYAIINRDGELKKTIELVPFSFDPDWNAMDDEFPDNLGNDPINEPYADDVIFGGLGSDWLHGGSGDDAISGAEALENAFVPVYDANGVPVDVLDLGYDAVGLPEEVNPGNVLAFNPEDLDGRHLNNRFRAGEFALYDEYDALRRVQLYVEAGDPSLLGTVYKGESLGAGDKVGEFLLNFDETEGVLRPAGTVLKATGQQTETYPDVYDDGADAIFGDLGNDWLVGGTGRDNMYGGWGNDLLNADDNHGTNGGLNDRPDTHPTYEDRAYGGAGRDVLIGNTGGDRLIDWVGEYNSYLVPYAPFGMASVSRTMQPFLQEFLYSLSRGDGADPSRAAETGADAARNGEPAAELGLVLQKDYAWQDQTGAPADPQAGNIPGGKRDVLRSANFNVANATGLLDGFAADSGSFSIVNGALQVTAESLGKDAAAVFYVDQYLPSYYEILASIKVTKPTAGWKANAYIIFDYYSPTDFKFAGVDISNNKFVMGHRTEQGWIVDAQTPAQLKADIYYNMLVAVNGTTATLQVNNTKLFTYVFAPRVVDGVSVNLNTGMVGVGSDNSRGVYDNFSVQRLAPKATLEHTDDFGDGVADLFTGPQSGTWLASGGRYDGGTAAGSDLGFSLVDLGIGRGLCSGSMLDFETTLSTKARGGIVYDYYGPTDFKFVAVDSATNQVILGHRTSKGWVTDAAVKRTIGSGDHKLGISIRGTTVNVSLDGQAVKSFVYNSVLVDGYFGLFTSNGPSSFNDVTFRTDDPAFQAPLSGSNLAVAGTVADAPASQTLLSYDSLGPVLSEAVGRLAAETGADGETISWLSTTAVRIEDLPGDTLGTAIGNTILLDRDAAGFGWSVDGMDLLSVVSHELGHVLGLGHGDGLMAPTLSAGVRSVPGNGSNGAGRGAAADSVLDWDPFVPALDAAEWDVRGAGNGNGPADWTVDASIVDSVLHRGERSAWGEGGYEGSAFARIDSDSSWDIEIGAVDPGWEVIPKGRRTRIK